MSSRNGLDCATKRVESLHESETTVTGPWFSAEQDMSFFRPSRRQIIKGMLVSGQVNRYDGEEVDYKNKIPPSHLF